MLRRIFDRIASIPFRHARIILIIAVFLTVAASVRVAQLKFEWDLLKYVPQDAGSVKDFNESVETFGSPQYMLVTLEVGKGTTAKAYAKFIEELAEGLSALPLVKRTASVLPDEQIKEIQDFALSHMFLYLTPEDVGLVKKRFSRGGIKKALAKSKPRKGSYISRIFTLPIDVLIRDPLNNFMRSKDPLGLNSLANKYFVPRGLKFKKHRGGKFHISFDARMAFFLIEPAEPFWNLPATEELVKDMNRVVSQTAKEYKLKNAHVSFAGYQTLVLENYVNLKRDTFLTLLITAVGVVLIFLIGFRKIKFLPYAVVPLVMSLVWTLGLASQLFSSINLFTCILAILILGLGIDFAIHLLNGYRSALRPGVKSEDAWRTSLKRRGGAILCGAFTTIAVFGLLMMSDFPGIQQLGLLVSVGLIIVLINVFIFMPSIIKLFDSRHDASVEAVTFVEKISWFAIVINRISLAHPKKVTAVALILTLGICYYIYPLKFSAESVEPFAKGSPSVGTIERFSERVHLYPEYVLAVSTGRTIPEVLATSYDLYNHLGKLQEEGYIAIFDSPSRYLPPYDMQRENLSILKNTPELNPETFRNNFLAELATHGDELKDLKYTYLSMATKVLTAGDIVTLEDVEALGFSGSKMKRYLSKDDGGYKLATYIFHRKEAHNPGASAAAIDKLSAIPLVKEGKVKLIGSPIINRELRGILTRNLKLIFACAILSILIILFIYFRKIKFVLLATVPVLFSIVAMLATFKLLGYELNFFNAIWLALILGIGIDSGVHMISGYQVAASSREASLGEVGRAVTMSTLTTLTAFGSMTLAMLPGLRSSGVLAGSGMIFSLIASLIFLPSLMKLVLGWQEVQK